MAEPQEGRLHEIGSAGSRLLNAVLGGDGSVTYSAQSWADRVANTRWGVTRVALLDWLNGRNLWPKRGHCAAAWAWHRERGLL